MIKDYIYKLLFSLLHLIYSCVIHLNSMWTLIYDFYSINGGINTINKKKKPNHIAIIIDSKQLEYYGFNNLLKTISYIKEEKNINKITLFDYNGLCQQNIHLFPKKQVNHILSHIDANEMYIKEILTVGSKNSSSSNSKENNNLLLNDNNQQNIEYV